MHQYSAAQERKWSIHKLECYIRYCTKRGMIKQRVEAMRKLKELKDR
jgi:hypothetical protein